MLLRVVVVLFLCFCSFGDLKLSRARTKRQDMLPSDENIEIEFYNNCTCVKQYLCDENNFIIKNGHGFIQRRMGQSTKGIPCVGDGDELFTCCKHKSDDPVKIMCGTLLPNNINPRILDDENKQPPVDGEFPWLVVIFKKGPGTPEWKFHASGSLIHPKVILTASHVVERDETTSLKVIANGHIELSKIGDNPLQERNVKEIIKHPDYNSETLLNDVALLILEESYKITSTQYINTLCLQPNISFETKRCLVAGWGRTENSDGTIQVLKKVELPTLSHLKCQQLIARAIGNSKYIFHESFMCAGGEQGQDACKGDGGSPLMCPIGTNNAMYQVGIVSWGIGCGRKDVPGAYTNVQFEHNWIVDQLRQRELELQTY